MQGTRYSRDQITSLTRHTWPKKAIHTISQCNSAGSRLGAWRRMFAFQNSWIDEQKSFCIDLISFALYVSLHLQTQTKCSHRQTLAFNSALSTPHSSAARPILRLQPHCFQRLLLCCLLRCFYPRCCRRCCCREIDPCSILIMCKAKKLGSLITYVRSKYSSWIPGITCF